eukprot:2113484-Rhodomonas_salina.1
MGMPAGGAAPAAAPAAAEAAPAEEKTSFELKLDSFNAADKLKVPPSTARMTQRLDDLHATDKSSGRPACFSCKYFGGDVLVFLTRKWLAGDQGGAGDHGAGVEGEQGARRGGTQE